MGKRRGAVTDESKKSYLEMAEELDGMDRDVRSEEADLLERALKRLRSGRPLRPKDADWLEKLHAKYLEDGKDGEEEQDELE